MTSDRTSQIDDNIFSKPSRMSDDAEASSERSLSNETECRTWKKRNIRKILFCGHVIWICQKCLSEKYETNSVHACCPQCQGPLVDPQMTDNGSGKILQENLFTDLLQEEEFDNGLILHEPRSWCSLHPKGNIPSVSSCRLCNNISDRRESYHLLHRPENIRRCLDNRNSSLCCIDGTDSTDFCSTHSVPICHLCKKNFHTECSVKHISEELNERTQMLLSEYAKLEARESFLRKKQKSAEKRHQEYIKKNYDEFEQLVKSIRDRQKELEIILEEKYIKRKEVLDRKLCRVIGHKSLVKRAMTSAPTPAFFDMTHTLKVICDNVVSDTSVPDDVTLEMNQDDISKLIEAIKSLGKLIEPQQKEVLHFDKYGDNIQLSENNKVAQRLGGTENGIVLSSQPMEYDKLYQVEVLEYDAGQKGTMRIGVWWKDAELALPTGSATLRTMLKSSALIGARKIWKIGEEVGTPCTYGKKLNDVHEGSRVGIAIRSVDCKLHLYIDEVDCGPSTDTPLKGRNNPPYAVFDVRGRVKKIRALPLKKVSTYSPTLPCSKSCKTCKQLNSACSISGPRGGLNLTSSGVCCHSTNVVYVLTCNKCNMLYVGETGGSIQKRCLKHRKRETNTASSVCKHMRECKSTGFSIAGVFKVEQDEQDEDEQDEDEQNEDEQDEDEQDEDEQDEGDDEQDEDEQDEQKLKYENQRKVMETILMLKLGTLRPRGINKKVSVKMN